MKITLKNIVDIQRGRNVRLECALYDLELYDSEPTAENIGKILAYLDVNDKKANEKTVEDWKEIMVMRGYGNTLSAANKGKNDYLRQVERARCKTIMISEALDL